ncbi:MAG: glycosyltransferase family 2 protein [Candidatus Competibacteraceae bacterium]|nr:glycosyltransferase family 2 protein [Candidatus Competibacteraceae bacterium]
MGALPAGWRVIIISIVTYAPDLALLATVLDHLGRALRHASRLELPTEARLILVDNGPGTTWRQPLQQMLDAAALPARVDLLSGHGNIGYGAGHNLALNLGDSAYHLILNPDVWLKQDALSEGLAFLTVHPDVGWVAPAAWDEAGRRQYLCKRYPTVLDLALRGFAPAWLRQRFQTRLDRYELRDCTGDAVFWDPPIASGCFMLCRQAALNRITGFSPDYFLYFEDFDLSLRLATVSRIVYVPTVRIVHFGGHAARKGIHHIGLFLRAAMLFFNRYGWRWW